MNLGFDNDRPIVLYNPHFDPVLSSWYDFGRELLDYFRDQTEYNLVFAPHVMLFQKRVHVSLPKRQIRVAHELPASFAKHPNIRIDTGSASSIDMTYTLNADIYLGDASSQVYEFLIRPRPCVFFNSHGADWNNDPDYAHWHLGPVITSVSELDRTLANIDAIQADYVARQIDAFRQTFDLAGNSSHRAAAAILEAISTGSESAS